LPLADVDIFVLLNPQLKTLQCMLNSIARKWLCAVQCKELVIESVLINQRLSTNFGFCTLRAKQ